MFRWSTSCLPRQWRGVLSVIGGFLVHFTLGTLYSFGNMNPYISSYLRAHSEPHISYAATGWIFALAMFGQGSVMWLGGLLCRYLNAGLVVWLGGWIMSLGVLLTALSLRVGLWLTIITYGAMFGVGVGLSYSVSLASAMSWYPSHRGLIGGIVVAGFGGGSLVFNFVQSVFINPHNLHPNITVGREKFFGQPEILQKVPTCFLVIGAVYAVMQLIGALLISMPTKEESDTEEAPLVPQDTTTDAAEDASNDSKSSSSEPVVIHTNKTALEVLKSREFLILWPTFFFNSIGVLIVSTLYKPYGELFIRNDHFLTVVGSVAAVFNAGGRILWGVLNDHVQYKWLMLAQTIVTSVMLFTFTQTSHVGNWMYFVWVCFVSGIMSGSFVLFPAVTGFTFGVERLGINYGMLFTANAMAGVIGNLLLHLVKAKIGWFGTFAIGGGSAVIGFVLTLLFPGSVFPCGRLQSRN